MKGSCRDVTSDLILKFSTNFLSTPSSPLSLAQAPLSLALSQVLSLLCLYAVSRCRSAIDENSRTNKVKVCCCVSYSALQRGSVFSCCRASAFDACVCMFYIIYMYLYMMYAYSYICVHIHIYIYIYI